MDVAHSEGAIDEQTEELAEEEIVERIFEAIIDQRLPAGTKLSESSLCEAFGVGRMRIRQSLLLLASREVVDLLPKRGAFVASPTADQAREVFEVRRLIEPRLVELFIERATPADMKRLKACIDDEESARQVGDMRRAIRASDRARTAS